MRRKMNVFYALSLSVLCLMGRAGPVKAEGNSVETINNISTGSISISLNEFKVDPSGKETPIEGNSDRKIVLPGEIISKLSKITVNGQKSWIRAKVLVEGDDAISDLDPSWVSLCEDDNWLKKGSYWYYREPVDHGKTIRFTKEVTVPDTEDNHVAGKPFHVIVWADAVQYDHFTPDFQAEDPWFGTIIETSVHDAYRTKDPTGRTFFVSYEGGAEGLLTNMDDAFANFQVLMPGDTVNDTLTIGNSYQTPVRLYFKVEGEADNALAKKTSLKIYAGEKELYSGSLAEAMNELYLAYMTPGWQAVLRYELHVPEELKNEFQMEDACDRWIFRAETGVNRSVTPNTGDTGMSRYALLMATGIAAAMLAVTILKRNRGE
ncbi:MAG: hypothetical protein IJ225_00195 [Solobacterium sp.]|nr:hypothetical protein [Solobacterium sp.]